MGSGSRHHQHCNKKKKGDEIEEGEIIEENVVDDFDVELHEDEGEEPNWTERKSDLRNDSYMVQASRKQKRSDEYEIERGRCTSNLEDDRIGHFRDYRHGSHKSSSSSRRHREKDRKPELVRERERNRDRDRDRDRGRERKREKALYGEEEYEMERERKERKRRNRDRESRGRSREGDRGRSSSFQQRS